MLDTFGAHGYEPGTTLLLDRPAKHSQPTVTYLPRHAQQSSGVEDRYMEPPVYQAAVDYLDAWYPSTMWQMRPLLSSFAHDGKVSPDLCDELANELLDCPPEHDRARDLVELARLIVEHLGNQQ